MSDREQALKVVRLFNEVDRCHECARELLLFADGRDAEQRDSELRYRTRNLQNMLWRALLALAEVKGEPLAHDGHLVTELWELIKDDRGKNVALVHDEAAGVSRQMINIDFLLGWLAKHMKGKSDE